MNTRDLRFESSMGRLDSMMDTIIGVSSDIDVLKDLASHAMTIAVVARMQTDNELCCGLSDKYLCHFDKLASRACIKGASINFYDFLSKANSQEGIQLLTLVTEMRDCLQSGINVMSIGDKYVLGEIAACLDEDIYKLAECLSESY